MTGEMIVSVFLIMMLIIAGPAFVLGYRLAERRMLRDAQRLNVERAMVAADRDAVEAQVQMISMAGDALLAIRRQDTKRSSGRPTGDAWPR